MKRNDSDLERLNKQKHGDGGPFLVCKTTRSPTCQGGYTFSECFKCNTRVFVSRRHVATWRNTGAVTVCARCSGGKPGSVLATF